MIAIMRRASRDVILVPFLAVLSACTASEDFVEAGDSSIIGGSPATGPELDAVGTIQLRGRDVCTGTLVAPQIVMTASHCRMGTTPEMSDFVTFVARGVPYRVMAELTTGPNGIGYIGAGRDAAMYLLESPVPASAGIRPIPIRPRTLDSGDEGRVFTVVGYGFGSGGRGREKGPMTLGAVTGKPYERRFATEADFRAFVRSRTNREPTAGRQDLVLSAPAYEVHAGLGVGDVQTCFGDSGGPLLDWVGDHYELVAITTGGDRDCALGAVFTAMGPDVQDALARARSGATPWAPFCGSELSDVSDGERSRCNGDEVVQCFGVSAAGGSSSLLPVRAIHLDRCGSYGYASKCETRADAFARCSHERSASTPPATAATDPDAIVQLLPNEKRGCLLRRSGRIDCWGRIYDPNGNAAFEPVGPLGALDDAISLSQGTAGFYALRQGGQVFYWGADRRGGGTFVAPYMLTTIPGAVELGGHCARTAAGAVSCIDTNGTPAPIAALTGAVQLAGGAGFACARRQDGAVTCWSEGIGATLGPDDAVDVAASGTTACAVRSSGKVACWGSLPRGIVTDGGTLWETDFWTRQPRVSTPATLAGIDDAVRVSVGAGDGPSTQVCALRRGGVVTCWGDGRYAVRSPLSAGASDETRNGTPRAAIDIRELRGVASVATSGRGACALMPDGEEVWCWGEGGDPGGVGSFGLRDFGGVNAMVPQRASF